MNFHVLFRLNPATGNDERYFRLKESFRDATGMVRNRTILTVGFDMNDIPMEDVRLVGEGLTRLYNCRGNRSTLFGDLVDSNPPHVRSYIENYWCPGLHSVYKVAPRLYDLKDRLERHLCQKTDDLFNLTNRIVLFDLTNFYFEGRKDGSSKARFGRSKEKRSDCKLLVMALRTNVDSLDEKTTWDYYNLIQEIECTNRQLKTDLNLRPIYHIKDECSDAHLFLGLLSYWIVNTIRYKLKQTGEKCYWTEIVRRLSTQKAITTEAVNALGEKVQLRQCSEPTKAAADIYQRLKYKAMPFRIRKKTL